MSSVTSWTRLEPRNRTDLPQRTLEARVADPLWMLARQWQFGELNGEDAGSPVSARLCGSFTTVSGYHPGPLPVSEPKATVPYSADTPLEALVEREPVHGPGQGFHISYEAGLCFLRLLGPELAAKYRTAFRAAYPFPELTDEQRDDFDAASLATYELLAPRAVNGLALHAALTGGTQPAVDADDAPAVLDATQRWLAWHDGVFDEPAPQQTSAWQRERLEYAFALSAQGAGGEVVLSAAEYAQGHLDWTSFDLVPGATLYPAGGQPAATDEQVESVTVPAPVRYRGMPVDRWWEFEDGKVNFGSADAGPADLARMLMIEFALVYGNDWFVIPVELPVGAVFSTRSLVVTDTFGVRTLDEPSLAKDPDWRMFDLTGGDAKNNPFFLPPALVHGLHSEPVEDVVFLRDETANLVWAVERTVTGPGGLPYDRIVEARRRRAAAVPPPGPLPEEPAGELRYRLSTEVPAPWIPLVPQQIEGAGGQVRLRRGALLLADGTQEVATAQGAVLGGDELSLYEEEVPRAGVRVTRQWQQVRWQDGSTHLWLGRTKQAGRGEGSSGLRFDTIEPGP
jgi:hypothetical protein